MEDNEITLTDKNMTRFLMSTQEAIGLVLKATEASLGGEIFVMRMPAASMEILSEVMIKLFGGNNTKIKVIGTRPGEKIDEVLVSKNEIVRTKIYDDKYYVILPQFKKDELENAYKNFKKLDYEEFNSKNTHQLSKNELEKILTKEDWLMDRVVGEIIPV